MVHGDLADSSIRGRVHSPLGIYLILWIWVRNWLRSHRIRDALVDGVVEFLEAMLWELLLPMLGSQVLVLLKPI